VTADYTVGSSRSIKIVNTQRIADPATGEIASLNGTLINYDPTEPGKWGFLGIYGFYWIVAVGVPLNGTYPWAVVSAPFGIQVTVLARDVASYTALYASEVDKALGEHSLNQTWNRRIETYQLGNCSYTW
jgi:lipocalin